LKKELVKLLSTFFYVGNFPLAPGSLASVVGVFLAILLGQTIVIYLIVTFVISGIGFLVSDQMEKLTKSKDPSEIVIDEVAGALIAFFLLPLNWPVVLTTFFLFRAFDMFKIYPVNKLEPIKGGVGVMMDDIVAGLYTNLVMQVAVRLAGVVPS
jgi:phosphatidylglycerophosphatase A